MLKSFSILLVSGLALGGAVIVASPAQATPQALSSTTIDIIAQPSGDGLLGSTAYVPEFAGNLIPTLSSTVGYNVDVVLLDGASELARCEIIHPALTCAINSAGLFPAGPTVVTARFTVNATVVEYTGTVFAVTTSPPTYGMEWQDASGAWVDGASAGVPIIGETTLRCVVTNNSNAPIELGSTFAASITRSGTSTLYPISGTIAAGATAYFEAWSGSISTVTNASCGGLANLRDGTPTGGGIGGSVIPVTGTIALDREPEPGVTVRLTGESISPSLVSQYTVLLDGVEVAGSPVDVVYADGYSFALDIEIPATLEPGDHAITVVITYPVGVDVALAHFPFEVAEPELAATGAGSSTPVLVGGTALALAGALMLAVTARRRRAAEVRVTR